MSRRTAAIVRCRLAGVVLAVLVGVVFIRAVEAQEEPVRQATSPTTSIPAFVSEYCLDCHNHDDKTGGLALDSAGLNDVAERAEVWERVVRKLRTRQMPPLDATRPEEGAYKAVLASLEGDLDAAAAARPNPGRTATFRRLTRTEYQKVIRDLLALDVDVAALLPPDESSHGFDNITVGDLSPTLLDRYISAAQKISRLAVGTPLSSPGGDTFRVRADVTQEEHMEGLPLGTRGGTLIPYTFPQDGEYEVQIRLARDRNEEVEGLTEAHELELLLNRERLKLFTVAPPPGRKNWDIVDKNLKVRVRVTAGEHQLGVTFLKGPSSLLETKRQPYQARFNTHRHPRVTPAVYQVSITGPYSADAISDTPSRRRLFASQPTKPDEELECAKRNLSLLMQRAYRRPVTHADLEGPLALYREARMHGDFETGIEMALSGVLISPHFLFRIERDPPEAAAKTAYRISDVELASRLSFFLWSSIPDDELLELAIRGKLSRPEVLERQVRRMLADSRSQSLATNFASQWLHLRNLDSITPDLRLFPDFDHNLRQAFRQETELLFESVVREDRPVPDLLMADYTYLNERLAKHYGIPHIYGSRFRRVSLSEDSVRGGLLRHGSVLTVTSYPTRTSPVIRGKWILDNLLGTPPPPPPANVPALKDNTVSAMLSVRERLAEHRANAACASCHNLMDPAGFSIENYDAVGRWRTMEDGQPIEATGGLPDGAKFVGVNGLEKALADRPELFVTTLTEKLLTYALGRGMEHYDAPAIRKIVAGAAADDYRFSSLIVGIAASTPFQMRRSE